MNEYTEQKTMSRMRRAVLLTIGATAVSLLHGHALATEQDAGSNIKAVELVDRSIMIGQKKMVVVRNQRELAALWQEGKGATDPTPAINFAEHTLIGLFLGPRPMSAQPRFTKVVIRREANPDRIKVTYHVKWPGPLQPGSVSLPAYTSVHSMWLIPKTDLPVEFIEAPEE